MSSTPRRSGTVAVIIGAGPAGLTAAYELLQRTELTPIVYEASEAIGGLARTVRYKGNRIDIGGHRFFSKSDRVLRWWQNVLPLQVSPDGVPGHARLAYQHQTHSIPVSGTGPDPARTDRVMLIRERVSRIYFARKFFNYPLTLDATTLRNLGARRVVRIAASYLRSRLWPIRHETTLEDFFINRFGRELYHTFFKSYTEKVWGVPCHRISAEWGAQRVKGLSISKALRHALRRTMAGQANLRDKRVETSLIERFIYPKFGPGQMWEEVARLVSQGGGVIRTGHRVCGLNTEGPRVVSVTVRDEGTGAMTMQSADYVLSSMPVRELVASLGDTVPGKVKAVADGLLYRDFVTVGLLVKRLAVQEAGPDGGLIADNWIYIQEPDVKLGRLQIFNNWSPYMVKDPGTVWLGLEYFCNEGDELWQLTDRDFAAFATNELATISLVDKKDVLDSIVIRVPKAYPAYYGSYGDFGVIRQYLDDFENLLLIGRNGMHRYNNQDHSMLAAMTAVDNIARGVAGKDNVWAVNAEQDYHEEK